MGRVREYQNPVRFNVILEKTEVEEVHRRARKKGKSFSAMVREMVVSVLSPPEPKK